MTWSRFFIPSLSKNVSNTVTFFKADWTVFPVDRIRRHRMIILGPLSMRHVGTKREEQGGEAEQDQAVTRLSCRFSTA